ncbi:hypothetical protein D3C87_1374690 [compost metagenome]
MTPMLVCRKRAHSSAVLSCEPLGLSVIWAVLPPAARRASLESWLSLLLSCAAPLLM